jgi:phosphocarrier protein
MSAGSGAKDGTQRAGAPEGAPGEGTASPAPQPGGGIVRVLEIINKKGLHARASAKFVQTVERFNADVRVTRGGETVGGDSIMGLMMLSAAPGCCITVEATGPEAEAAMQALTELVQSRFGEED